MIYAIVGFVFGALIPQMARRFEKFMPATPAYALWQLIKPVKTVACKKKKANEKYMKLAYKFRWRSFMYALVTGALSYASFVYFGKNGIWWHLVFFYILLLCAEIDAKMWILPDILTYPLLILGFAYAVSAGQWVNPTESAIGALVGYFLPVFASLFIIWKNKDAFGGGDIKLLSAIGAWMGVENVLNVIIGACVVAFVYMLITKKRITAFGPAIVMASIGVAFWYL